MKRISIRELQRISSTELKSEPFEITKHGKTIAKVTPAMKSFGVEAALLEYAAQLKVAQNDVVSILKTRKGQSFSSSSIELKTCPKHGVYKRTCGCK